MRGTALVVALLCACSSKAPTATSPSPPDEGRRGAPDSTADDAGAPEPDAVPAAVHAPHAPAARATTEGDSQQHMRDLPDRCLPGEARRVETIDLNRDGKPDVHKVFAPASPGGPKAEFLVCKRMDMNQDGTEEYVATYDPAGGLESEQYDFTFDGLFDMFKQYDPATGRLIEAGRDTNSDGLFDLFELYDEQGKLALVTRDQNGDGSADRWEVYQAGTLIETQVDEDFDGRIDKKTQ